MSRTKTDRAGAAPELGKPLAGAFLILLAVLLWSNRDSIASWFAASYVGTIRLATTTERDDTRVCRCEVGAIQ
jgi:hypothetical protein